MSTKAALHRRIGGAQVMADQLNHLIKVAARPSIQLRVIPFDIGGHSAINGSFVLLKFPDGRPVVHL